MNEMDKKLNTMIAKGWKVRSEMAGEYRQQITARLDMARNLIAAGQKDKALATLSEIRGVV